jgi:hypothetical protein
MEELDGRRWGLQDLVEVGLGEPAEGFSVLGVGWP